MTKNRKFLATAATAAVVVSAVAPTASAANFQDVTDRYKDAVDFVISKGGKGLNAYSFGTSSEIKRVDAAVLLAKVLGLNTQTAPASGFKDVPARAEGAVNALKAAGITSGKTKTTFDSNSSITRGELAIWLHKGFGLKGNSSMEFKDVTPMYKNAVQALAANGVTKGTTEDEFGVNLNAKRGDYAIFLHKSAMVMENMVEAVSVESVNNTTIRVKVKGQLENVLTTDFSFDGGLKVEAVKILPSAPADEDYTTVELTTSVQESGKTYKLLSFNGKSVIGDITFKAPQAPNPGTPSNPGTPTDPPVENFNLSLMHTNDTHANIDNAAKRATAIKEYEAGHPDALLLDAGDVFSGTLYFNKFQGEADLKLMNYMGYDAMTFGNHEFDLGSTPEGHQALAEFVQGADFPFVSSNVDFSKDSHFDDIFNTEEVESNPEDGQIYNAIVKEVDGEKIGILGLTTEETAGISSPGSVEFQDYIEEAQKAVDAFEEQGINKIIALTHIGYDDNPAFDNDQELAKAVDGIDVIVGGHSHTFLGTDSRDASTYKPVVDTHGDEPTVIVTAYQYSTFLGTLDVEFDKDGKVVGHAGELVDVSKKTEDAGAAAILKPYADEVKTLKEESTGATASVELVQNIGGQAVVRNQETNLGNLIADGMLSKAKQYNEDAVIAFQNGGGIRASINSGEITVGELITTLPFGNTLATMKLTGAEVKAALEQSVSIAPALNGGFLQVSGLKFTYDTSKGVNDRVTSVTVQDKDGNWEALNLEKEYVVATNAFTAKGGDNYKVFEKAYKEGRVTDLGLTDWEVLQEYVKELGTVNPSVEGRIVQVVEASGFSGTEAEPKVYSGNVTVDVTGVDKLEHAHVKGNLYIKGDASTIEFNNVEVDGETEFLD
ncbi:5'-nucleotidase C-terminal domain-containing protein [Bacillus sp. AG4(2022)]|uniref:5'-nucleotidase C-terminal domain-containing protein n=1 Tax=Bacillus sp. AG4(2022) TaxID=2962594 RepID=UPI002881F88F|nr:5'-nucleotidase C-terminal domain-containing protein [Bacillus sp. AG4(2022)]MDT0161585.1 5'-nucleotidase C-terminal domain-containing protein [Bacillus sp. AG4(2022)]